MDGERVNPENENTMNTTSAIERNISAERHKKERIKRILYVLFWSLIVIGFLLMGILLAIFARTEIEADFDSMTPEQRYRRDHDIEGFWEIVSRIAPEVPADSTRSGFATGGENWWDIWLQYSPRFLEIIFMSYGGMDRLKRFLTKEEIIARRRKGWYVEELEDGTVNSDGKILCYIQSKKSHRALRIIKIVLGIALVAAAFFLKPFLIDLTSDYTLHGLTQALFSLLFVTGILFFAGAMKGLVNNIDKQLFAPTKDHDGKIIGWGRPKSRVAFKIGMLIFFTGAVCCINVIANRMAASTYQAIDGVKQLVVLASIHQNTLLAITVLFGIAVLGRIFIEDLLKPLLIKAFKGYNTLMGINNQDDKFTNDAINANHLLTHGTLSDRDDFVRLAVPNGRKLFHDKNGHLIMISKEDVMMLDVTQRREYAYDEEGNFYATTADKARNHKKAQRAKLIAWMLLWYALTLTFYGVNYILDKSLMAGLTPIMGADLAAAVFPLTDGLSYIIALVCGAQAVNVCIKLLHIFSTDKSFLKDFTDKKVLTEGDKTQLSHMQKRYEAGKWAAVVTATTLVGAFGAFVVFFAEQKVDLNNFTAFGIAMAVFIAFRFLVGLAVMFNEKSSMIEKLVGPNKKLADDRIAASEIVVPRGAITA